MRGPERGDGNGDSHKIIIINKHKPNLSALVSHK